MRLLASLALLLCVVSAPACSSETGILITTTTEQDQEIEFDHFQVFVGERLPIQDPENDPYYTDTEPLEDVQMEARNLAEDPYKLLIQPDGNLDAELMVAVVAFSGDEPVGIATLGHPVYFVEGKVAEWEMVLRRFGDGDVRTDTGCVKFFDDNGVLIHLGSPQDADCDLVTADNDCNDFDPNVSPRSPENCDNGIDDNCNGLIDLEEDVDNDEDGFSVCGGDCDDGNPKVNPDAEEVCDGLDNDCNFQCDDGFDGDGDSYSVCGTIIEGAFCQDGGPSEEDVDCNDEASDTFPGADEHCDGKDNDCNGICDDDEELDPDDDGFTECGSVLGRCGVSDANVDCKPNNGNVHPAATEFCNGIDDNCDGLFAELTPCYAFQQESCIEGVRTCDEQAAGGEVVLGNECLEFNGDVFAAQVCDTYNLCEDQGGTTDPLECFFTQAPDIQKTDCKVNIGADGQCGNRQVVFASPGPEFTSCRWAIVGGADQNGYVAELFVNGTPNSPDLTSCNGVSLRLTAEASTGNTSVFVSVQDLVDPAVSLVFELEVESFFGTCEANTLGFTCNGLENLALLPQP